MGLVGHHRPAHLFPDRDDEVAGPVAGVVVPVEHGHLLEATLLGALHDSQGLVAGQDAVVEEDGAGLHQLGADPAAVQEEDFVLGRDRQDRQRRGRVRGEHERHLVDVDELVDRAHGLLLLARLVILDDQLELDAVDAALGVQLVHGELRALAHDLAVEGAGARHGEDGADLVALGIRRSRGERDQGDH